MTRYLLDTNVVSVLAPSSLAQHPALAAWLHARTSQLYLPSIAIAELSAGVARLRRIGANRKADILDLWMANILLSFVGQVLPVDAEAAHVTGLLLDRANGLGLHPGFPDLAIAGVANSRGLTVLTRNLRHFTPLGIAAIDPFATLPG